MYLEFENKLIEKIEKITSTKYTSYEYQNNLVSQDDLFSMIDDLVDKIDDLEDKINEMNYDIEENYEPKKINPYEEYGVSERDFM